MKSYANIGVALDGSETAARSLGCATWLASRLGARLHILHVGEQLPSGEALRQLGVPEKHLPLAEFHQMQGDAAGEILAAEERYRLELLVMTAQGAGASGTKTNGSHAEPLERVGHVTREVIERSQAPVLLLPPRYRESLPWRSALVPLSGEPGSDQSLGTALQLAQVLDLTVTIAHVAATSGQAAKAATGSYSDEPHHEYPNMLNEFVARACPMCGAEERRRIGDFHLVYGDVAHELLVLVEKTRASLIVVGWHGQFVAGHARVLKALIQNVSCPLLLVKAAPLREPFRLKVGEEV